MDYEAILREVQQLDFVTDRDMADAATKAVIGTMTATVGEREAKAMVAGLPHPLRLEDLHPHQATPTPITHDEFVENMIEQFKLGRDQAEDLIDKVLDVAERVGGYNFKRQTAARR